MISYFLIVYKRMKVSKLEFVVESNDRIDNMKNIYQLAVLSVYCHIGSISVAKDNNFFRMAFFSLHGHFG